MGLWENFNWEKKSVSFGHRGLRYDFLRKKIWTVPLILQFNLFTIYLASSPSLTTVNEREYESSFSLWKFHHRARLRQGNISTAANSRDFAFSDTVNFVTAVAPRTLSEWK